MAIDVTKLALEYQSLCFSFDVEGSEGRRNYSVDVYEISKNVIKVTYEADEDWTIKVSQTFEDGQTELVSATSQDAFNEENLQCNLERHHVRSKIFKNCAKGIGALFGVGIGIATVATAPHAIVTAGSRSVEGDQEMEF